MVSLNLQVIETSQKAIVSLSVVVVILLGVIWYIIGGDDTTKLNEQLIKNNTIIKLLKDQNDSLMSKEQFIVDEIDSTNVTISDQKEAIVQIKYIYKDAKINLFSLSTDSNFMLLTDNLSEADSIKW